MQALSAMAVRRHGSAADLAAGLVPPPQQLLPPPTAAGGLQTYSDSSQGAGLAVPAPQAMDAPPVLGVGFAAGLQTPVYSRCRLNWGVIQGSDLDEDVGETRMRCSVLAAVSYGHSMQLHSEHAPRDGVCIRTWCADPA